MKKIFYLIVLYFFSMQNISIAAQEDFYCENGNIFCGNGIQAYCKDPTYKLTCTNTLNPKFAGGLPDCCKQIGVANYCSIADLTCPDSPDKFEVINVVVKGGPKIPDIVQLPFNPEDESNGTNFAFIGSNPTFQIELPREFSEDLVSVDIKDRNGIVFESVPFSVIRPESSTTKFILTLELPDGIAEGTATFALNLSDGTALSGIFQVLDFISIQKSKSGDSGDIGDPIITNITEKSGSRLLRISITGNNFVGNKAYIEKDGVVTFEEKPEGKYFTEVVVLPNDIGLSVKKVKVINEKRINVRLEYTVGGKLDKENIVLVVSTPRGIASASEEIFIPTASISPANKEVTCVNDKPTCSNGKRAKCSGGFTPTCSHNVVQIPDCCYKSKYNIVNKCNPNRLYCPE